MLKTARDKVFLIKMVKRTQLINYTVYETASNESLLGIWHTCLRRHPPTYMSNVYERIPFGDCWIWTGPKLSGYGIMYIKLRDPHLGIYGKSMITASIMAAWARNFKKRRPGQHASHLCHRRECFNPNHLVFESASKNAQRNHCPVFKGITFPQRACDHNPPCLRRRPRS